MMDPTKRPDVLRRGHGAALFPDSAPQRKRLVDPDQLFGRRLAALLRDPAAAHERARAREVRCLLAAGISPAEAEHRAGRRVSLALSKVLAVRDWRAFTFERPALPHTEATRQYLRAMRARRLKLSVSSLYAWRDLFIRGGLEALAPLWSGGRPPRLPDLDYALIRDLWRAGSQVYRVYMLVRRDRRLPGRPVSVATFARAIAELEQQRQRSQRAPRKPRTGGDGAPQRRGRPVKAAA
jgi:hypothetical protein